MCRKRYDIVIIALDKEYSSLELIHRPEGKGPRSNHYRVAGERTLPGVSGGVRGCWNKGTSGYAAVSVLALYSQGGVQNLRSTQCRIAWNSFGLPGNGITAHCEMESD
jgi:hypothetical protein